MKNAKFQDEESRKAPVNKQIFINLIKQFEIGSSESYGVADYESKCRNL